MELLVSLNEKNSSPSKKMSLKLYFTIFYTLGLAGALIREWRDTGFPKLYLTDFSIFDHLERFFNRILSLAGIIDTFLFPSLASAITITAAIHFYRGVSSKLKNSRTKPAIIMLFIFSTFFVWMLLSFLVVIATA
jgi:hypothetical protein